MAESQNTVIEYPVGLSEIPFASFLQIEKYSYDEAQKTVAKEQNDALGSLNRRLIYPASTLVAGAYVSKELDEISKFLPEKGNTIIKIKISDKKNDYTFQLKNKRNIDRKTINLLRNKEISAIIC